MSTPLPDNELHIWMVHAVGKHPRATQVLCAEELERAARFYQPLLREQWAFFRVALREILGSYVNCAPRDIRFRTGQRGKPALAQGMQPQFNLTHSSELALLAVTNIAPVGVDVEFCRELADMKALVRRNFSLEEQDAIAALPVADQNGAFYDIWTRKEAVIKANGMGLALPLDAFEVVADPLQQWAATHIDAIGISNPDYLYRPVQTVSGYKAAAALDVSGELEAPAPRLCCYNYQL